MCLKLSLYYFQGEKIIFHFTDLHYGQINVKNESKMGYTYWNRFVYGRDEVMNIFRLWKRLYGGCTIKEAQNTNDFF